MKVPMGLVTPSCPFRGPLTRGRSAAGFWGAATKPHIPCMSRPPSHSRKFGLSVCPCECHRVGAPHEAGGGLAGTYIGLRLRKLRGTRLRVWHPSVRCLERYWTAHPIIVMEITKPPASLVRRFQGARRPMAAPPSQLRLCGEGCIAARHPSGGS